MTRQEIFNKVRAHLLKQNAKAMGPTGGCEYRTADGLKCAVGVLISDEKYHPGMGKCWVAGLWSERDAKRYGFKPLSMPSARTSELLESLQYVHDNEEPAQWPAALARVAVDYGLADTEVAP
jgi:hypothetical protein